VNRGGWTMAMCSSGARFSENGYLLQREKSFGSNTILLPTTGLKMKSVITALMSRRGGSVASSRSRSDVDDAGGGKRLKFLDEGGPSLMRYYWFYGSSGN